MASGDRSNLSKSVVLAADKARAQRVARVKMVLDTRVDNALAILDALIAELGEGDAHPAFWEQLHAASCRDHVEAALGDAYQKCSNGVRMKRLSPQAQADVFMHAADFFQGVLGDGAAAESFLHRVLTVMPTHTEAFSRLEKRYEKLLDARRLVELYASVAAAPPKPASVLSTQAFNRVLQVTPKDPIPDEACRKLIALVPANSRLLDALEAHCRATKRAALACELIECALPTETLEAAVVQRRHKLLELYVGDAANPAMAIGHVEELLKRDPSDATALKVGERLLSVRDVASRAAAALQTARRTRGY